MTLLDQLKAHDHCGLDCFECDRYVDCKCELGKSSKSRLEVFAEAAIEYFSTISGYNIGAYIRRGHELETAARWLRNQEGK